MIDQDISQRLSKLERQNRTMKILLLLMFCAGVFIAAKPAAKVQDLIQAKRIEVVDNKGFACISLGGMNSSNIANPYGVCLNHPVSKNTCSLSFYGSTPCLTLSNEKEIKELKITKKSALQLYGDKLIM